MVYVSGAELDTIDKSSITIQFCNVSTLVTIGGIKP